MPLLSEKQVYIRSRRPHHPALRCDHSVIFADQFENGTDDEYCTLKHLGNDIYIISVAEDFIYRPVLMVRRRADRGQVILITFRRSNTLGMDIHNTRHSLLYVAGP